MIYEIVFNLSPANPWPDPGLLLGLLATTLGDTDAEWKTKYGVEICFLSMRSYSSASLVPKRD